MGWLLVGPEHSVDGDFAIWDASFSNLAGAGLAETLPVYPLPALVVLYVPWLIAEALGGLPYYLAVFAAMTLAFDGFFTWLLARCPGAGRSRALGVWVLAVPLLGATAYTRFDLLPGVLSGAALLLVAGRSRLSAMAVAVATSLKFWPGFLIPALATRRESRVKFLAIVAAVGGCLAGASLLAAGWHRLLSPLDWQSDRGLHVESVPATPAMLAWASGSRDFRTVLSQFSIDIEGRGVSALLTASSAVTALGTLALIAMWTRAWRRSGGVTADALSWMCLVAVTFVMVSSRALSPQYLLWLLPLAAAALAVAETDRSVGQLTRWSVWLLVATAATQLVYPLGYDAIIDFKDWSIWIALVLAIRNLILLGLLVRAVRETLWHLGRRTELAPRDTTLTRRAV